MKYIIFSFDDGRKDTYTNAIRILDKYNMKATINICTSFVEHADKFKNMFITSNSCSMSCFEVVDAYKKGYEIASHSDTHCNDISDIITSLNKLKKWGIDVSHIGFASPNSYVCNRNINDYCSLLLNNHIKYIRSGRQLRRDGLLCGILTYLSEVFHSKILFRSVNKKNIINKNKVGQFIYGISINKKIKNKQIYDLINHMKEDECAILMYHAIIDEKNIKSNKNKWFNTPTEFEELCDYISRNEELSVIRTIDLYKENTNV